MIPQSTLGFASVPPLSPTLSSFLYSRLLHATHQQGESIAQKLTRVSAASHAFKALDQVQVLRKRLDVKRAEEREEMLEDGLARLELEMRRRRNLGRVEAVRLRETLQIAMELETEAERIAVLSAVLPQQVAIGAEMKTTISSPSEPEKTA